MMARGRVALATTIVTNLLTSQFDYFPINDSKVLPDRRVSKATELP
jgi:hypothetical protein